MEVTIDNKKRILWLRNLLKENAPKVYDKFAEDKTVQLEIPVKKEENKLSEEIEAGAKRFEDWMKSEDIRMGRA